VSSLHVVLRKNKFYTVADIDMWCDRYNFLPSSAASVNLQATLCAIIHRWFSFPDTSFFIFLVAVDVQWHFRLPVQPPCSRYMHVFRNMLYAFFYHCPFVPVIKILSQTLHTHTHTRARACMHACMHVCMYVYIHTYIYIYIYIYIVYILYIYI